MRTAQLLPCLGHAAAAGAERRLVKVWRVGPQGRALAEPMSVGPELVTVQVALPGVMGAGLE